MRRLAFRRVAEAGVPAGRCTAEGREVTAACAGETGMKLLRWGERGAEKPGILDAEGRIRDLSSRVADIDGTTLGDPSLFRDIERLPVVPGSPRIGACVGSVGKMICVGLNYADHAAEAGLALPSEANYLFQGDVVDLRPRRRPCTPQRLEQGRLEVELGVVIGRALSCADEPEARRGIAGYCVINDISERGWQLERGGQWVKGKSADGFGPMGPLAGDRGQRAR